MTYLQKYTKWFNIGFTVHPYDGSSSTSGESLGRRSNELIGNRNAYLHSATSGVLDMHVQIKKTNGRGKEGLRHQRMTSMQCLWPPPLRHKSNHKLINGASFSVLIRSSLQKTTRPAIEHRCYATGRDGWLQLEYIRRHSSTQKGQAINKMVRN